MSDIVRIVDAVAWPVVALIAIMLLAQPSGRQMLERLFGRLTRFKAAGFEIELTSEVSRAVKANLKESFQGFVNGHRVLPRGGHRFSPVAAMFSPRWRP
jgi:hypothetical protein